jgi:DNA repair photolyase
MRTSTKKRDLKPVTGTGEWASSNVNIQSGCEHDCRYCYAKSMAIRFKRATTDTWSTPVIRDEAVGKGYEYREGQIMFPSTHDITPRNIEECLAVLRKLLNAGNPVLIVSKPHMECVKRMCDELADYRARILFRFTIGSADNRALKRWEPGAPTFGERLQALKWAHSKGYATSMSCEPMLDAHIDRVITAVEPYVTDSIWLGRANHLRGILALNCPGDVGVRKHADELIATWDDTAVKALYQRYKNHPLIRWKDSIKEVVGVERPTEKGLDI